MCVHRSFLIFYDRLSHRTIDCPSRFSVDETKDFIDGATDRGLLCKAGQMFGGFV